MVKKNRQNAVHQRERRMKKQMTEVMKKLYRYLNQGNEGIKKAYTIFIFILSIIVVSLGLTQCPAR